MSGKNILKMVVQMTASIYASKMTHKVVGELFDRAFGRGKKGWLK